MKFICIYIILLLTVNLCFSQTWSDPINISGPGYNGNPDFTIDKFGTIHCVWSYNAGYPFEKIYYSKSSDDGETWTNPIPIATNQKLWLDNPHIITDTSGNLFVSYDYDVGGYTKICYVKFTRNNSQWSQQKIIGSGVSNRLAVDNNNRVYFFWFTGTEYYKYLDNNILSDSISLSSETPERYFFDMVKADKHNNLHCVGNRTAGTYSKGAYFFCHNGEWKPFFDLSSHSFFESGLSLNKNDDPSFVWRQIIPDSLPNVRGTFYTKYEIDTIESPVFLAQRTSYPAITIDGNDQPHIIESQAIDSGNQLVHRYISNGTWKFDVVEYNKYWYDKNILISQNFHIYLVYNKIDTALVPVSGSYNAFIMFRHLEIVPGIFENLHNSDLNLYPNPFSEKVILEWPNSNSKNVYLRIFDIYGRIVYEKLCEDKYQGTSSMVWNGNNLLGNKVKDGCYFVQLSSGSIFISKILIHLTR